MDKIELTWLAEMLGITPDEASKIGVDECTRRVHVIDTQNPFDVAYQG